MIHWPILDETRRKLIPQLGFLAPLNFYLAGGTALALHYGHRTSVDFDFYTATDLRDVLPLLTELQQHLPDFVADHIADGTLIGHRHAIEMSFFRYQYPMLESLVPAEGLQLASIPDIAAMKMAALAQRGLYRDFVDLYVIAQQHGVQTIITWAQQKFPQLDPYVMLRALMYFVDAENDTSMRGKILRQPIAWETIKTFFSAEVRQLEKVWL